MGTEMQDQGIRRAEKEDQATRRGHSVNHRKRTVILQGRGAQQQDKGHHQEKLWLQEHRELKGHGFTVLFRH